VITADVIQPTTAGAGNLYSREYFELVRGALRADGLAVQWIGERPNEHYRALLRTFLDVFPESTLWFGGNVLVGSPTPLRVDPRWVDERFEHPRLRQALDAVGIHSIDVLRGWYTAGPDALRRLAGEGELLTDDRPLLEYHRSFDGGSATPNLSEVRATPDEVFGGR
jgi:spermidine synthase